MNYINSFAKVKNGTCLDTEYKGSDHKYFWKCKKGHTWRARYSDIKVGKWCKKCDLEKRRERLSFDLNHMKRTASERGGQCLSKKYINAGHKYKWKCIEGHVWETSYMVIRRGAWCKKCVAKKVNQSRMPSLNEINAFAKTKGGKCLSENYVNYHTHMKWQCMKGHKFSSTFNNLKKGNWCPECSGRMTWTIEKIKAEAKKRNGRCLSKRYINQKQHLKWKCQRGHEWESTWSTIHYQKSWCPECRQGLIYKLSDLNNLASSFEGQSLESQGEKKPNQKLKWGCKKGHTWKATYREAHQNWCPQCSFHLQKRI